MSRSGWMRRREANASAPRAIADNPGYWNLISAEAAERMRVMDRLPQPFREIAHEYDFGPTVKLMARGLTPAETLEVLTISRTSHRAAYDRLAEIERANRPRT